MYTWLRYVFETLSATGSVAETNTLLTAWISANTRDSASWSDALLVVSKYLPPPCSAAFFTR